MATKLERVEEALAEKYEYRYNVLTSTVEFRNVGSSTWKGHFDYDMNSIIRQINRDIGETVSQASYKGIVQSDYSQKFHPVRDYFNQDLANVTDFDGSIRRLSETVIMKDQQQQFAFRISLRKWVVASVANAMEDIDSQNHTCIVFTGGMGKFKSKWLNNLCPKSLRPAYLFCGKIDLSPQNKDVLNLMVTKFVINLDDQLRNLMKKDSETMKTFITQPEITMRRPYGHFDETYPRLANYVASINGEEFLAENENRRFLPFQVVDILLDQAKEIDMDLVWKEGLELYRAGLACDFSDPDLRYWWLKEELDEAFPNMQDFAFTSDELNLITANYEVPDSREKCNLWANSSEIVSKIKSLTGVVLSSKKVGEAMKSLNAQQHSIRVGKIPVKKWGLFDPNIAPSSAEIAKIEKSKMPL